MVNPSNLCVLVISLGLIPGGVYSYAHWPLSEPTVWRLTQGFTRHLSLAHQPHVARACHVEEAGSLVHCSSIFLTEIFIEKRENLMGVFTYKCPPPHTRTHTKWPNMPLNNSSFGLNGDRDWVLEWLRSLFTYCDENKEINKLKIEVYHVNLTWRIG